MCVHITFFPYTLDRYKKNTDNQKGKKKLSLLGSISYISLHILFFNTWLNCAVNTSAYTYDFREK